MSAAGTKVVPRPGRGNINEVWSMGQQYEQVQTKVNRNALEARDINGSKKNRFGHRVEMPVNHDPSMVHGKSSFETAQSRQNKNHSNIFNNDIPSYSKPPRQPAH